MSSANEYLQLIIRTANNKYADFEIQISSSQTVFGLKEKIQLYHPTKPIPKDQRLIFSGKLLVDTSQLQDVFSKSTSSSLMIHLVLDSDKNLTAPKSPSSTKMQSTPVENKPTTRTTTTTSNHSSTYEQYLTELNYYQQQLQQFLINPNGSLPMNTYENQAYLQYCYTHYQMYQNLHTYQRTVASPISINTSQSNVNTTSPPAAPPPAPAAAAAAGGNNNNDLEQENDLLGILNMLVELFVLCSIIYFYSTFSRFLLVFLFFALLYLHCRGYLSLRGRRRVQPPPPPAPVLPEQQNEGGAGTDEEPEIEVNPNENPRQPSPTPAPPPANPFGNNQLSATRVLLTAVSTFFSSLIPERPQHT